MREGSLTDAQLLTKYQGLAIPPLVDSNDSRFGLVNGKLLEIYQHGFGGVHNLVPLGVLLVQANMSDNTDKWLTANYNSNGKAAAGWTHFCRLVREFSLDGGKTKPGNIACEKCDRHHAAYAEKQGQSVAYLCCHGMIDFAVPVKLGDKTIAVLFSGQLHPNRRSRWAGNLIQVHEETTSKLPEALDLVQHSEKQRARLQDYGIPDDSVNRAMKRDARRGFRTADPAAVREILSALNTAALHLSDLASKTFVLEKQRVTSLIRFQFCQALMVLKRDLSNTEEALMALQRSLSTFGSFFGLSYAALLYSVTPDKLRVLCHVSPFAPQLRDDMDYIIPKHLEALQESGVTYFDLSDFQHIPSVRSAYERLLNGPQNCPQGTCIRPKETPNYALIFVRAQKYAAQSFAASDIQSISEISSLACLVCETLNLLIDLKSSNRAMDKFMEDVAHDLRSPIQSIIMKVSIVKRCIVDPKEYVAQASKLGAAVMRVDLVTRRIWIIQKLQRGELTYVDSVTPVRETISKVVDTLEDLCMRYGVQICPVWDSIDSVPHLKVDKNMFFETILNIVDNGIKYSRTASSHRLPQVVIKAWHDARETVISIGNRGIEIGREEFEKIFQRYYRSQLAKRYRPDGAGIGLSIVKDFMDHYRGAVQIKSERVFGTDDFLNIFELHFQTGICR